MPFLFSYGTLQQKKVQLKMYGRLLPGHGDELVGFEESLFEVKDPEFVRESGKGLHAIVRFNGQPESRVSGMVFEVTEAELSLTDDYEPKGYKRVRTTLASGTEAWVFADERD